MNRGRKTVAIVAGFAPSLIRFRLELIRRMRRCGHRVVAYAPEDDTEVRKKLADLGVEYRCIPLRRAGMNPFSDLALLWHLVREFRRLRPDVLIPYTMKPVIYAGIAGRLTKIPTRFALMTGLGYVFADPAPTGVRALLKTLSVRLYRAGLKGAVKIFVYNRADADDIRASRLAARGTEIIMVPGTGVDLELFAASPPPVGPPSFLLIARLLRDKGIVEYVQAAKSVKDRFPETRFSLLGPLDPSPNGISLSEIERWHADGRVAYLGETNDVCPYIDAHSVLVLPSYYREGVPRSILEAMAKGRPVITTNLPGCGDTIEHGVSGYLVPPRNADALAEAMCAFARDHASVSHMGRAARHRAETMYDIHKVNRLILGEMGLYVHDRPGAPVAKVSSVNTDKRPT